MSAEIIKNKEMAMQYSDRHRLLGDASLIAINIICFTAAFIVDVYTPLGVADGIIYLAIILLTIWVDNNRYTHIAALIAILLTILGYFLSPQPSMNSNSPVANRLLSITGIIFSALVILKYKKSAIEIRSQKKLLDQLAAELTNYNNELELRVGQRTAELETSKQELKKALEKEKQLNELKSRFVSMVSHEFRTPLTTVSSSVSLLSKYAEAGNIEKQSHHVARIKTAINHLTDLLSDVLSLSRLEEGRIVYKPEKFGMPQLVREILDELEVITKPGQLITYHHEGAEEVYTDRKIITHTLMNLISNAIKFSEAGAEVIINSRVANGEVEISVSDKGIGISDEDQRHLFERFFRGLNASNIQGTGLGLNIVAKYVEVLSGKIHFKSKIGEGTTFWVKVPIS